MRSKDAAAGTRMRMRHNRQALRGGSRGKRSCDDIRIVDRDVSGVSGLVLVVDWQHPTLHVVDGRLP
jgi:hypothetical protein